MTKRFILFIILVFLMFANWTTVLAQNSSLAVGISIPISDKDVQDGDVICSYTSGNKRCNTSNDTDIYGIVNDNPSVQIQDSGLADSRLVVRSGITNVRVSSANGNITKNDFLTTSENPGIAVRETSNGFVIGQALEDYNSESKDNIGKIQVLVNIHTTAGLSGPRGNLIQYIRSGIAVPVFNPVESLRYILAALMVIISFALGMIYFGRASRAGIEAVGRNPLAKRVIQLTIFLNIALTIVIVIVGLGIAYLILIL